MIAPETLDAPAPTVTYPVTGKMTGKSLKHLRLHRFLDTALHVSYALTMGMPLPSLMLGGFMVGGVLYPKIFPANETIIIGMAGSTLIATAAGLYEATCKENNNPRSRLTHSYNHRAITIEPCPQKTARNIVLTSAFMGAALLTDVSGAGKQMTHAVNDFVDSTKHYLVNIQETTKQHMNIAHYSQSLRHTTH
ncbi:MAG TPA: hypothetical protein VGF14_04265 [Alphaproteobacteria bacterium]